MLGRIPHNYSDAGRVIAFVPAHGYLKGFSVTNNYTRYIPIPVILTDYGWTPELFSQYFYEPPETQQIAVNEHIVVQAMMSFEFADDLISQIMARTGNGEVWAKRKLSQYRRHALTQQREHFAESLLVF